MNLERERGIFTVEGLLSIEALLSSSYSIRSVFAAEEKAERVAALAPPSLPVYTMPARAMEAVTGVHFHRGVLAVAERPDLPDARQLAGAARRLLILEAVNDHENIGALFRNAAAFGVDAVILDAATTDPLYRRSTRVSLGHVLRIPFARVAGEDWLEFIGHLGATGVATVALTPAPGASPLAELLVRSPERVGLIVGAEGPGLASATMAAAKHRVRIPMRPGVDSVNVATAAAIVLAALHGFD